MGRGARRSTRARQKHGEGKDVGLLRISFPGYDDEDDANLEPIEWDEFFQKFDESELSFLYQERTADGELSTFNKFTRR
jgi:hypothetical protein